MPRAEFEPMIPVFTGPRQLECQEQIKIAFTKNLNSVNACYYPLQDPLPSHLLFENRRIKIQAKVVQVLN
jgi:hypothetical protein